MTNYRRLYVPNATYFFTLVTYNRMEIFNHRHARTCLREAFEYVQKRWPFSIVAFVLLPNHIHTLWTLPENDTDYSTRWRLTKSRFSNLFKKNDYIQLNCSDSRRKKSEQPFWQRRFWEHVVRDERDFQKHIDYIHYNPVKHGYVVCVKDWEFSTFHRYVQMGWYSLDWGSSQPNDFEIMEFGE